jgi:predicted permease
MKYLLLASLNRLRAFIGSRPLDRELDVEMSTHLDFAIEENLRRGLSMGEARRQALVSFGGVEQAKEQHREARGWPSLDILWQDLRYAFRTLRRDRAFTLIAVLVLALGIGANVTVFSVVNTILIRPLPFRDSQQITWLAGDNGVGTDQTYRVDAYEEIQRNSHSFQDLTAYVPYYDYSDFKLTGYGEPKPVLGVWVAGNFFQALGVQPALGRLFITEEYARVGGPAVVLTRGFWQRQFGADSAIVGRSIRLNNREFTVVGVLPPTFDFAAVFAPGLKVDLFAALNMNDARGAGHVLSVMGRLKPGLTAGQAQAEVRLVLSRSTAQHPEWLTDVKTRIVGLKDHVSGKLRHSLIVLWCGVGLILLIVCVNLSNLILARAAARSKEFAIRSALGGGRGRLIRQLLTESTVLSSAGALLGLGFGFAMTRYLAHQGSLTLPLLSSLTVDGAALGWTVLIAVVSSILFGLVPSLGLSGANLQETLKDAGDRGMSVGRSHERTRSALVVSEVALACVLMVGAGLLLRSFLRVLDVDLGFQPSQAAAIKVDYDDGGNRWRRGAILEQILEHVAAIPGIEIAGVSDKLPLDRHRSWDLRAKGRDDPSGWNDIAFVYVVTPGYFKSMGMNLRRGRDFTWQDTPASDPVIVINEAAARRDWPGVDAVGKLAQGIDDHDTRVVGVVSNVRESSVEEISSPEVYVPATQAEPDGENLVVRTKLPPEALASSVLSALRTLNPGQPAAEFRSLQQLVDNAVSPRRFFASLVTCFAVLGLVLASLGIYGVISYSVTRRTQEIGIRMALGATASQVEIGVIAKTLRLSLLGIALGTVASLVLSGVIASLLFETEPTDVTTFGAMILLLSAVAVLAGYIPARRASRIDPMIAFRAN